MDETRMRGGRSLAEALEGFLTEWSERTGIAVEIWALPRQDVPSRIAQGVLATVEDALSNVERHSEASTVSIAITVSGRGLRLTVSDDGNGIPASSTRMRARFAEIGGSLSVNSVRDEGTTVTGVIPRR